MERKIRPASDEARPVGEIAAGVVEKIGRKSGQFRPVASVGNVEHSAQPRLAQGDQAFEPAQLPFGGAHTAASLGSARSGPQ